jgi:hypothetical protein
MLMESEHNMAREDREGSEISIEVTANRSCEGAQGEISACYART